MDYICKYCDKKFNNAKALAGHLGHCKHNPNFDNTKYFLHQQHFSLAGVKAKNNQKIVKKYICICNKCGKEYELELTEKRYNKGNYPKFCSRSCANSRVHSENTKHKISNSLKNNKNKNFKYISEYFLDKKYFLDFYIIKNGIEIDLEIDGKQHKYEDHIEHDKRRDEYIKSKNIIVYRIEWNEINSENGSNLMKEKIDNFLEFYNKL